MNWWNECLYGVARAGKATIFLLGIGVSDMWERSQMFKNATAILDEARVKRQEFAFPNNRAIYQGPTFWIANINIFRDKSWK